MLAAGQLLIDQGWAYDRLRLSPLKVVGCEGLLGFVLTVGAYVLGPLLCLLNIHCTTHCILLCVQLCVVLPVAQVSGAPEGWGLLEDSWDSLVVGLNNPWLNHILLYFPLSNSFTAGQQAHMCAAVTQHARLLTIRCITYSAVLCAVV
jgi:hypothetical protein